MDQCDEVFVGLLARQRLLLVEDGLEEFECRDLCVVAQSALRPCP